MLQNTALWDLLPHRRINLRKLPATSIADCWRYSPGKGANENGAQIDLLFDRYDSVFQKQTKTDKQIFMTLISANGIKPNMYSEEIISSVVSLYDLF